MTMTATYLGQAPGFDHDARHYLLDPPMRDYDGNKVRYVVVSAVDNMYATETYIFPSDTEGEVVDWLEMPGSWKGVVDCDFVLRELGYTIV